MKLKKLLFVAATAILFGGSMYSTVKSDPPYIPLEQNARHMVRLQQIGRQMEEVVDANFSKLSQSKIDAVEQKLNELYDEALGRHVVLFKEGYEWQKKWSMEYGQNIENLYNKISKNIEALKVKREAERGAGKKYLEENKLREAILQEAKKEFLKAVNVAELLMRYEFFMKKLGSELSEKQMKDFREDIAETFKSRYVEILKKWEKEEEKKEKSQ